MTQPTHGLDPNALEAPDDACEACAGTGMRCIGLDKTALTVTFDMQADCPECDGNGRAKHLAALPQNPGTSSTSGEAVGVKQKITAYEAQVLIGTSISGCNMPPDRTFDLTTAWARLYALGLIDRADGIACPTSDGTELIASMLRAALEPRASDRGAVATALRLAETAIEAGLEVISDGRGWGTYPRMEGSDIYSDAQVFDAAAQTALAAIRKLSEVSHE